MQRYRPTRNLLPQSILSKYINLRLNHTRLQINRHHANIVKMPNVMITLKEGASADQLDKAKKEAQSQGGEIVHESKLIKSITVKFPDDKVHTLSTNEHYTVENDQEVRTQ